MLRLFLTFAVALVGCKTPTRDRAIADCPILMKPPANQAVPVSQTSSRPSAETKRASAQKWRPSNAERQPSTGSQQVIPAQFESPSKGAKAPGDSANYSINSDEKTSTDTTNETPSPNSALRLDDVLASVMRDFPTVQAALLQFDVAQGQVVSAAGAFDTKFKGDSVNGPVGFYETYRHSVGIDQPLAFGGNVFGGYRIGRGSFQPWYRERQTNDGGEFKAGLSVPLSRNVDIDDRRAGVQRANLALSAADPMFRQEVIGTVQAATVAYWQWVAAAKRKNISQQLLDLASKRNRGLEEEVKAGAKDPPVLKDNQRAILSRQAKLVDAQRKLIQAAAKLSIFLRDIQGNPVTPSESQVPEFLTPKETVSDLRHQWTEQALQNRPGLRQLGLQIERIDVELAASRNDLLPNVDAILIGSQDVGVPTSKKRDKSQFELEAGVLVNVPLQRRKARGKIASLEAKRAQVVHKRNLLQDKIKTEIDIAFADLEAASQRVTLEIEARDLALYLAEVEREKFEAGQSDLLAVALRESKAAEEASEAVDACLEYHIGRAALKAAIGINDPGTAE